MAQKTLLDLSCENFDLFFAREVEFLTPEQKEVLPKDLSFRLFRRGGVWDSKSTSRLSFLAKAFVLVKALRKRIVVIVEDQQKGIGLDQYKEIRQNIKRRDYSVNAAEQAADTFDFYLGDKELMNAMQYLNYLHTGAAYNYLLKGKNTPINRVDEADAQMAYIIRFLMTWEGNKKTIISTSGLTMPEIYVLLYLYEGKEMAGKDIYQNKFKRAYQSTPSKVRLAFCTLFDKGYITKYGGTKGLKLQITSSGKAVIRDIATKYAVNC